MEYSKPRYTVAEARALLGLGHSALYQRIKAKKLVIQKDGRRTFVTSDELKRYIDSCGQQAA